MSIETPGGSFEHERREFIERLNQAHEQFGRFYDIIEGLDSSNQQVMLDMLTGIEHLLIAEETKIAYPEKYNPKSEKAREYFQLALARYELQFPSNSASEADEAQK
jgi:hypothetical protein